MRCWVSGVLALALAGCAASPSGGGASGPGSAPVFVSQPQPSQHPACLALVDAWAQNFQANVRRLDGQQRHGLDNRLELARKGLAAVGIAEERCNKPMCIIEPKANGRLESYCGYRIDDESGAALYRWVRWEPSTR